MVENLSNEPYLYKHSIRMIKCTIRRADSLQQTCVLDRFILNDFGSGAVTGGPLIMCAKWGWREGGLVIRQSVSEEYTVLACINA
jgi:hypothetical protein